MRHVSGLTMWHLVLCVFASVHIAWSEADEEKDLKAKEDNSTRAYRAPSSDGLHWLETFDGDVWSRWKMSTKEKYDGKFEVRKRKKEALVGDLGLVAPDPAKHYGISTKFPEFKGSSDAAFVLQFEVRFQEGLQCGGSYAKLFDGASRQVEEFDNEVPFVIMFGPDRCGATDKVHFILQHKNPVSGKWEEKHLENPPSVPYDQLSHVYTLIVRPDNSFDVQIDGEKKKSGDLLTSMSPPINPPKEIDDPEDSKPGDWINEPKMSDPAATKPEDWDEDEPSYIEDPKESMPAGWREDLEKRIPDPTSQAPEDWDTDEDGEWEAPEIDNPECKVGCGKWVHPKIANPKYKGKWHAPQIDNPEYKGVWAPRQIANPNFFEDKTPGILPMMSSLGIDIWTMQGDIIFDNFLLTTDEAKASALASETWKIRRDIEDTQNPTADSDSWVMKLWKSYWVPIAITSIVILASTVWCCTQSCCKSRDAKKPKKKAKKDADPSEEKEEKKEVEKKEDKAEETKEKAAETEEKDS
jgi:calnexin